MTSRLARQLHPARLAALVALLGTVPLPWVSAARADTFVYAANCNCFIGPPISPDTVSQFLASATPGALSPLAPPAVSTSGDQPWGIAATPDGRSLYVTNEASNTIAQFDVAVTGTLTPKAPATVSTAPFGFPSNVAVHPDGGSFYVVSSLALGPGGTMADAVLQYDIAAGGLLVPKAPPTVAAGMNPFGIAITPDGRSLYVGSRNTDEILQYDVAADGTLAPKVPPSVTVAANATLWRMTVSPDGDSLYASDIGGPNGVFQFDIAANGTLAPKVPASVALPAPSTASYVLVSFDGKSAYVSGATDIFQFDIAAGGLLAPKAVPSVPTGGANPAQLAMSPDGRSVYAGTDTQVFQFDVGAGGALAAKAPPSVAAGDVPWNVAALAFDQHYQCYQARETPGTPRFVPLDVALQDQFGTAAATVKRPRSICNPVSKNSTSPTDPTAHLTCYATKDTGPKPPKVQARITNQFGTQDITVGKPLQLCVPSEKGIVPDAPVPSPLAIDHYRCYKAKASKTTPTPLVDLQLLDQFGFATARTKPCFRFCAPVDKNGSGILDPDRHLACYRLMDTFGGPMQMNVDVNVDNQFGAQALRARTMAAARYLCVPSTKQLLP